MMQNVHRITGSRFMHAKPGLCAKCVHRSDYGEWEGYCRARGKVLSAPKSTVKRGRCADYAPREEEAVRRG